ncbi:hypothetical protein COS18_04375, partial [Candidatus Falkowbacteria bacterium CG02_land_8_20_14_3_00_36_14]
LIIKKRGNKMLNLSFTRKEKPMSQNSSRKRHFAFPAGKEDAEFFVEALKQRLIGIFPKSGQELDLTMLIIGEMEEKIRRRRKPEEENFNKVSIDLSNLQSSSLFGVGMGMPTFGKVCGIIEREAKEVFALMNIPGLF